MSIINQTLRALDARQPDATAPQVSLHPAAMARRRWAGRRGVAAVLLLLAGVGIGFVFRPAGNLPSPRVAVMQRAGASPAAIPVAKAVPVPPAVAPLSTPKPANVQVAPVVAVNRPRSPDGHAGQNRSTPASPARLSAEPVTTVPASPEKSPVIRKEDNPPTAGEAAEERYRRALTLIQKDRENQARPLLEEAIALSPGHVAARETLAALLSEAGQNQEAEAVLRAGRELNPDHAWFALSLARLQAARGDVEGAVATLQSGMGGRGVNAEYRATLAALLVRLRQYPDAARQYEQALRQQPGQGTWWLGLGLAMEAQGKNDEARSAFRHALTAGNLPDKLAEFVRAKLAD
jgi:MSHA biogenesis protein MshN